MPEQPEKWVPAGSPRTILSDGTVVLRLWAPADAEMMHSLITANIDHLRPTMPWIAHEPLTVEDRRELLLDWERACENHTDFGYVIFVGHTAVGSAGLHARGGPGTLEIGYWVASTHAGGGVATRAAVQLAAAALSMEDVTSVEIHHDQSNPASGRVAEKAGFRRVESYPRAPLAPADSGTGVVWCLER